MLNIDKDGWVIDQKINVTRRPNLAHGRMSEVHGIIIHQTGASTAQSTLSSYLNSGANGAHFLIVIAHLGWCWDAEAAVVDAAFGG